MGHNTETVSTPNSSSGHSQGLQMTHDDNGKYKATSLVVAAQLNHSFLF
ncbi:hypothetical protein TYRP_018381 [Tyrophagus putrescentiae]|nr:hypothetical protein TYRP_018381 [Tyrophagus putrescentiae]